MKQIPFAVLPLFLLFAIPGFSQSGMFVSSGSEVVVKSGTPVSIDALVLTPAADFTITGATGITRTANTSVETATTIRRVFHFSAAIPSFSGTVGIYYSQEDLNTLSENALVLYAQDGDTWKAYPGNVSRNATTNLVTTTGLANFTLKELTLTREPEVELAPAIVFNNIAKIYGEAGFSLSALSNSTGAISYAVVSGNAATITEGGDVTIHGTGSVLIRASQVANGSYAAGAETATLTISPASNAISFTSPGAKIYGDDPFTLNASANSGGAVSYTVVSGPATVSGSALTITGAGVVTVKAISGATTNYLAAADELVTFTISKALATISFSGLSTTYDGLPKTVDVTINPAGVNGVTVKYNSNTTAPTEAGSYAVSAVLANANYTLAKNSATATLEIGKAANRIDFGVLSTKTYGDADFALNSTSSSGLDVTYTVNGNATVSGTTVHLTGAGTATITAHQSGSNNYEAAPAINQTFIVAPKTISVFITAESKVYDGSKTAVVHAGILSGLVSGDEVTVTAVNPLFDNKNAGAGKVVRTNILIGGAAAGNYTINSIASALAAITKKEASVSNVTAGNKIYNGNTGATLNTAMAVLSGIVASDAVTLAPGSGTFADKHVGINKAVTASGFAISGADAGNYSLAQPTSLTAAITPRSLTVSAAANNKVYDGNTNATVILKDDRITGDVFTLAYTTALFADKNVGTNKSVRVSGISIDGTDAKNYTANTTAAATAAITALYITVTPAGTPTKQYSDPDPALTYGFAPALGTGDAFTGALSRVAGEAPGDYSITQGSLALGSNYALKFMNPAGVKLQIGQEDATADYTGAEFASTGAATATSARLRLSAAITDAPDGSRGDITNARVRFKIVGMNASLSPDAPVYTSWRPVALLTSDRTTGTAVLDTLLSVGSFNAKNFDVYIEVGNYYTNADLHTVKATITVSKSLNDYITGGGNLTFGAGTANSSRGVYRSGDNTKTNFGFNVKYSKTGNNLQGNVNLILRSGTNVYQVKGVVGGANGSLSTNVKDAKNKKAVLTCKASLYNTTTGVAVPNGSSATLHLTMTDKGEPGINLDTYGITLWGSDGTLLYSNNWLSNTTAEATINGGNIQVKSTVSATTTVATAVSNKQAATLKNVMPEPTDATFGVTAFPNPSVAHFNIRMVSNNTADKISLRIMDVQGRILEVRNNLSIGQTIQLGSVYRPGAYFAELQQGSQRRQVKLLKMAY